MDSFHQFHQFYGTDPNGVHVDGYPHHDGSYVKPHFRTHPDGNPLNNWSMPGNLNPHTGHIASGNIDTYLSGSVDHNQYGLQTIIHHQDPLAHVHSFVMQPFSLK